VLLAIKFIRTHFGAYQSHKIYNTRYDMYLSETVQYGQDGDGDRPQLSCLCIIITDQ